VRVVARGAGEPGVAVSPAAAVLEAIGLEADVDDTGEAALQDVAASAMARTAKIDGGSSVEVARIENRAATVCDFSRFHGGDMFSAGAVAGFAGDTGRHV
jgi:hypothetical protein